MNDELGCFLCFAMSIGGFFFVALVIAWKDTRDTVRMLRAAVEQDIAAAHSMRLALGDLTRRIAALESAPTDQTTQARSFEAPRAPADASFAAPAPAPAPASFAAPSPTPFAPQVEQEPSAPAQSTFARPIATPIEPSPITQVVAAATASPSPTPSPSPSPSPYPSPSPSPTPSPYPFQDPLQDPSRTRTPTRTPSPSPSPSPTPSPTPEFPAPPPPPTPPADSDPNWEQWLGVRGAAAAGSIVLAIAAVYFFRYSMDHGLIGPAARVMIGVLVGLGCIGISEAKLRHTHTTLSQFLAGAGFAILYLATWAAVSIYELIPSSAAAVGMIAITSASCALAYTRRAAPTAALGLLGGFATPILLSTGQDRPVALFAYLFLLDLGLLILARKRAWSWLAAASLLFTFLYQAVWISARLDAPRTWLGVAIVVVFPALYAVALPRGPESTPFDRFVRVAAVALAGLFALVFGASSRLGENLVPTATMLILLTASGGVLARIDSSAVARPATAMAALGTMAAMLARNAETPTFAARFAVALVLLAAVQFAVNELERRLARATPTPQSPPDEIAWLPIAQSLGFEIVLFGATLLELFAIGRGTNYQFVAHYLTVVALLGVASVESIRGGRSGRMLPFLGLASLIAILMHATHGGDPGIPSSAAIVGMMLGLALLAFVTPVAIRRMRPGESTQFAEHGTGLFLVGLVVELTSVPNGSPFAMPVYFAASAIIVLLVALVASLRRHGGWALVAMIAFSIAHLSFQGHWPSLPAQVPLLFGFGAVALLASLLPLLVVGGARDEPMVYRAAALAGPSVFFAAMVAFRFRFGRDAIGAVPLVLSLFSTATILLGRLLASTRKTRDVATVWGGIAALTLVSIAIPLQLRDEWVTVSWALQGAIVIAMWSRFDHPGLKYYALFLFTCVFVRLVANPAVLDYHAPSGRPIVNWLAYTYLVPAAAMVYAAQVLARFEVPRFRSFEQGIYGSRSWLAGAIALFAILVGFAWVNLTVIDAFAVGGDLRIPFERRPARDLAISLAWALYAVFLLAVGMWKTLKPLRLASLGIVLVTCLKVFLYDLGRLQDLYRVASLVGLAFALIGVSLAYKQFVFREPENRS